MRIRAWFGGLWSGRGGRGAWTTRATLVGLIIAAGGGLVTVLHGRPQRLLVWLLAAVILVCLIGLLATFRRQPQPEESQALLLFREPSVEPRTVRWSMNDNWSVPVTGIGHRPDLESVWCVYAQVENVPRVGEDGVSHAAGNVHATLRFMNDAGDIIAELAGRWAHRPQDAVVEATQAPATADLPPNSGPYKIDVAIKYPNDPECFAWNDQTRFETTDLRGKGLGADPVTVEIDLRGSGVGVTARATYRLSHSGIGPEPPTMTRIS
jgi:hypothetical protein